MAKRGIGFTIIELLIVVTLIAILAGIAFAFYKNVLECARSAEAYSVLADIASAESAYFAENSSYTLAFGGLDRFDAAPISDNFTYSLTDCAGMATAKPGIGSTDYYMWYDGSAKGTVPGGGRGFSCP